MNIKAIPALDFIGNKIVRLKEGDFNAQQDYDFNPNSQLEKYEDLGFDEFHLVDLDGAKNPIFHQREFFKGLIQKHGQKHQSSFQWGGGIRLLKDCENGFEGGFKKAVISSLPFKNPKEFNRILEKFGPSKFVIAADCKKTELSETSLDEYSIKISGWLEDTQKSLRSFMKEMIALGLTQFLVTDISKDGMGTGPSFELYEKILQEFPGIILTASGGVSSDQDILKLEDIGVHQVVIGKALLEGKISFRNKLNGFKQ